MSIATETDTMRLVLPHSREEIDLELLQGLWTEAIYLKLSARTRQLLEFTDGEIEVLPMPTQRHQQIVAYLYRVLFRLMDTLHGLVLFAPLRLEVRPGKFREPDLLLVCDRNDPRLADAYWLGADLVVEIVSPDAPERDLVTKRADYAEASIPEYWIVNPLNESITVLTLDGQNYHEHGVFRRGEVASSPLLPEVQLSVASVFDVQ